VTLKLGLRLLKSLKKLKSLEIAPFDTSHAASYKRSTVTMRPFYIINFEKMRP